MKAKQIVRFIAANSYRALFWVVLCFTVFMFTEPSVGYGRFSGITDTIVNGLMIINLCMWVWTAFWLVPRKHFVIALIALCVPSYGFWLDLGELQSHQRQFYNSFLMFNAFGTALLISYRLKIEALKAGLFGALFLIIILALLIKPIGLFTGLKSEHDFVEVNITYFDLEHKIVRSKETRKGYDYLGEKLEFHDNGTLKYYFNTEGPEETPWVEYHKNGMVYKINCYYYKNVNSKKVKALYGVFFDDTGMPRQASTTYGQVVRYHYNGFVFLSGHSLNNKPYGKWYFYSYEDGSVVDSVDHSKKQRHTWDSRNDLITNRFREKDSSVYKIRYDQKLMGGVSHYKPDSLYEFALSLKAKFDQKIEPND